MTIDAPRAIAGMGKNGCMSAADPIRLWSWNLNGAFNLRQTVVDFIASADV